MVEWLWSLVGAGFRDEAFISGVDSGIEVSSSGFLASYAASLLHWVSASSMLDRDVSGGSVNQWQWVIRLEWSSFCKICVVLDCAFRTGSSEHAELADLVTFSSWQGGPASLVSS